MTSLRERKGACLSYLGMVIGLYWEGNDKDIVNFIIIVCVRERGVGGRKGWRERGKEGRRGGDRYRYRYGEGKRDSLCTHTKEQQILQR